jgi:gliding motility-associated-like protein
MSKRITAILVFVFSLCINRAMASHIVGGEFTYKYIKDTFAGRTYRVYQVNLTIYQDCITGQPEAIAQDNPAFLTIWDNAESLLPYGYDTSVFYDPLLAITVPANFSNSCVTNVPNLCLLRKSFIRTYYLPVNAAGYTFVYQRCCRNSSIVNVIDPGDKGATYFCTIPGGAVTNSSAVFKNYPPQIICLNNPLYYDNSATDADGDSLSYEFCPAFVGATDADIKPIIADHPPFDTVAYFTPPYTYQNPITGFPAIAIDPVTGIVTGTPNRIGRYLVTICCNEWRHGVLINTIKREFQFVVTDCSKVVVANVPQLSTSPNTYIVDCADYTVHFVNTSKGGFSYRWDFGVDSGNYDTSTAFEPTFTYPDSGTYLMKLVVNPTTTCPDSITRLVKIYPKFNAAFIDSGDHCPGGTIAFVDLSTSTMKPISYWKWNFGDGDSSLDENPLHTFMYGGTYNVILIAQNVKDCTDTALRQVLVENFKPFAGNDTIIVKGESIRFDAQGGIKYSWLTSDNLSDTNIANPKGFYPDTGLFTYYVHVESAYGCKGDDTVKVLVVNQASFVVPNAFTPNGDGLNDVFRPIAVGYRSLKYFGVYNRFGQEVYHGTTLEVGWDGTFHNRQADIGTYFWQISFVDRFGKEGYLKGDVTLIR